MGSGLGPDQHCSSQWRLYWGYQAIQCILFSCQTHYKLYIYTVCFIPPHGSSLLERTDRSVCFSKSPFGYRSSYVYLLYLQGLLALEAGLPGVCYRLQLKLYHRAGALPAFGAHQSAELAEYLVTRGSGIYCSPPGSSSCLELKRSPGFPRQKRIACSIGRICAYPQCFVRMSAGLISPGM